MSDPPAEHGRERPGPRDEAGGAAARDTPARATHSLTVSDDQAGARVDALVAELAGVSGREARRLVLDGGVLVDGRDVKKGDRLRPGQLLEVVPVVDWLVPADLSTVRVAFVDNDVVVVDKPAGIACHPLVRGEGGTLLDVVAYRFPEVAMAGDDPREGGLVHRLDNLTSGLVCFARTPEARARLMADLKRGEMGRAYVAIVGGLVTEPTVLQGAIAHDRGDDRRMVVARRGVLIRGQPRSCRSAVVPLERGESTTLVRVDLEGGRRHQIRVHLADAGHPLLGDELYGGSPLPERAGQALHAHRLDLAGRQPVLAPVPEDLAQALERLGMDVGRNLD